MPFVFGAPISSPTLALEAQARPMTWTGFDGSQWDLADLAGILSVAPGVTGLHMPAVDVQRSSTPLVPGVDLLGYSIPERSVYWPLNFRAFSEAEWRSTYSGFFDSMHPVDPGVWTVGEGADARTLQLTGDFRGDYAFTRDPFVTGFALIGVELIAPRPLWRGRPIKKTFGGEEGVDFIPTEPGDSYYPSPAATFQEAQIDNPGNEPAYLTWTAYGPLPELAMGVGGAMVEVPFPVDAGSTLVVDTDPAGQYATLDGVDCTRELGFQMFAPVPAKGTSPLAIAATGEGQVVASLTPLYWRAF